MPDFDTTQPTAGETNERAYKKASEILSKQLLLLCCLIYRQINSEDRAFAFSTLNFYSAVV